jgi:hypothetical protein
MPKNKNMETESNNNELKFYKIFINKQILGELFFI